jgi:SNF2 family DNA or RNA helicase
VKPIATCELGRSGITLDGPLDRGFHNRAETVRGGRFNGATYTYPLTLSTCYALRKAFGTHLRIGPELNRWAREQRAREEALGELAELTDARLDYVSERIDRAMESRSYQRVAAAFVADAGSCLIADQPGLGKTIEILAGLQECNPDAATRYHLVFAPVIAVEAVWPGEVAHWCGAENAVAYPIRGKTAERSAQLTAALSAPASGLDVYVLVNLEMARLAPETNAKGKVEYHVRNALYPPLFGREWDTIIVDESHRALIKKGKTTQTRAGLSKLRSKQRIAMSGTPMRGKPEQLWGTLNWLRPDIYPSYWRWLEQYWEIFKTRYSSFNIGDFLPGGEDRLADDLRSIMLRRTKAEVLPELPSKLYAGTYLIPDDEDSPLGVWLEMTPAMRKRYEFFEDEGTIELPKGWLIANGALAERTRKLQLCASWGDMDGERYVPAFPSPKFDWLEWFLDKLGLGPDGENEERCIVASYSTALLELFSKELTKRGYDNHLLTGNTSGKARAQMIEDFQSENPCKRVFLLNSKAGGVAATLDMSDYLVMLDESTIPDDDEQVEDRAHRTSRIHQLTIYKLRMLGTVEEEIAWIAAARQNVQSYILDGARGVEYARNVYLAASQKPN